MQGISKLNINHTKNECMATKKGLEAVKMMG
jgi:hypothetical protein